MKETDIMLHHMLVRETVGYEFISKVEIEDLPNVLRFLQVVWNYKKMKQAIKKLES